MLLKVFCGVSLYVGAWVGSLIFNLSLRSRSISLFWGVLGLLADVFIRLVFSNSSIGGLKGYVSVPPSFLNDSTGLLFFRESVDAAKLSLRLSSKI